MLAACDQLAPAPVPIPIPADLSRGDLLAMYLDMCRVREFEEAVKTLFMRGLVRGSTHLYIGQEAIAVGACKRLRGDDYITSTHRGHGHCIAKGCNTKTMMAEILGKATGYCKGKGGSMHIADMDLGILGANGVVGGGQALAAGAGLTISMMGCDRVVVCFFGCAAANQGVLHESMNLASVWRLPVIYLCENNGYGVSTPMRESTSVPNLAVRASAYAMPGVTVDGNDVVAVYMAVGSAVDRARHGGGPSFVECMTYRWEGHYVGDPCVYRTRDEVSEWKRRDPIRRLGARLVAEGFSAPGDLQGLEAEAKAEIAGAVTFAEASPGPDPGELMADVYA